MSKMWFHSQNVIFILFQPQNRSYQIVRTFLNLKILFIVFKFYGESCTKSSKLKRLILIVLIVEYTFANVTKNDTTATCTRGAIGGCDGAIVSRIANNPVSNVLLICELNGKH